MKLLVLILGLSLSLAQEVLRQFPEASGANLSKEEFDLPQDFAGELNLVLVAFKQNQQSKVDTWLAYAEGSAITDNEVSVYELPVLGSSYRLLRGFIDGGMRSGIPDPVARARTITLYGDKPGFMEALAIPDENDIHAFLVDGEGQVLWQAAGEHSEAKAAELEDMITWAKLPKTYKGGL